jgi:hypothetical protein
MENVGLMFECDIVPRAEVPVGQYVECGGVDSSYAYYDISRKRAVNMMSIAISGYVRF